MSRPLSPEMIEALSPLKAGAVKVHLGALPNVHKQTIRALQKRGYIAESGAFTSRGQRASWIIGMAHYNLGQYVADQVEAIP